MPLPRIGLRDALLRRGPRTVLLTYPGLRLGNYLYFALHAFLEAHAGREFRVLDTGMGAEWYDCFPGLSAYLVERARPFDRRAHIPRLFFQQYGTDFTGDDLNEFITSVLNPEPPLVAGDHTVTVNMRRGDYYESDERINDLGLNARQYLLSALSLAEASAPIDGLWLISDDSAWAARELAAARPDVPVLEVVAGPPTNHLLRLAGSRRLILANSSFSYWGGYLSEAVHGSGAVEIYAPAVHSRSMNGGLPWQHAPTWTPVTANPPADG